MSDASRLTEKLLANGKTSPLPRDSGAVNPVRPVNPGGGSMKPA
jgi:hypothetical protein